MDKTLTITDLEFIRDNFLKELEDAKHGKKTSFPFIAHQLPASPIVKNGETFQVMVIGGTIFRKALMKKENGEIRIFKRAEKFQPPFHSKEDFLLFVEKELAENISVLALNFAYPMKPVFSDGRLDGKLLAGSKENTFGEMVGKQVGEEIEKYILKTYKRKILVSSANDTVCLVLSGLNKFSSDELIGGIVGTGLNFGLFLDKDTIINLEAANFDKFPKSSDAIIVDKQSASPGRGLFEKEIAGAYLYKRFNILAKKQKLNIEPLHSTQELDQLSQMHTPIASKLAKEMILNSASLIAAAIAALTLYKKKDLVFVVEGSLFWLADGYRQQIQKCLLKLVPEYKPKFTKITHSTLIGGAKLVA